MNRPTLTIGLPVFNGSAFLPAALDSLLGQERGDFDLVISDNASTDDTQAICLRYAERDPRVRYYRNDRNLGVMANFLRVLELATGDYFMWASHDDVWSPNYIASLLPRVERLPTAVLSAGRTVYVTADNQPHSLPSANAPPSEPIGAEAVARQFLQQHATSWFYGIYRRAHLPAMVARLKHYPEWGGDVLFLLHACLNHDVVGSDDAIIYKRVHRWNPYRPQTPWQSRKWKVVFTARLFEQLADSPITWRNSGALLDELRRYIWFIVVNEGRRRTARQIVRDTLARVRGMRA